MSGLQKTIRRKAKVDPVWAKFIQDHTNCCKCNRVTLVCVEGQISLLNRIYIKTYECAGELMPEQIKCYCRECYNREH